MYKIEIVLADSGWILERLAKEISKAASEHKEDISLDIVMAPSGGADLVFFLPYSVQKPLSNCIVGSYFSHQEEVEPAASNFIRRALEADFCICSAIRYQNLLVQSGAGAVHYVPLGVDTKIFYPELRIGVVGRTYHTGRKGEALLARLLNKKGIKLIFTGAGWPGVSSTLGSTDEMREFYNSLDYLLIPSTIEGGPVPLLEAVSCGIPIISADVGCVEKFTHIPFLKGDSSNLEKVVDGLLEDRNRAARAAIEGYEWSDFGRRHVELFLEKLQSVKPKSSSALDSVNFNTILRKCKIFLVSHGSEAATKGGPSTRISFLLQSLLDRGFKAELVTTIEHCEVREGDLVHIFNVWPMSSCAKEIALAKKCRARIVYSPIALDLKFRELYENLAPDLISQYVKQGDGGAESLDPFAKYLDRICNSSSVFEGVDGHHSCLASTVLSVDKVICLSDYERNFLKRVSNSDLDAVIVRNGVDIDNGFAVDKLLFQSRFGLGRYALVVGRIETRKNQAAVVAALKGLDCDVVLLGHVGDSKYFGLVKSIGNNRLIHIDRIEDRALLFSAYKGASVVLLPSWAEGAPLAAIEAASVGASLILSNQSGENEYFGGHVSYVNPLDLLEMRRLVVKRIQEPVKINEELMQHIANNFTLDAHARETINVYEKVFSEKVPNKKSSLIRYLDISHLAHAIANNATTTGVVRLEKELFQKLRNKSGLRYLVWNSTLNHFVELDKDDMSEAALAGAAKSVRIPSRSGSYKLKVSAKKDVGIVHAIPATMISYRNFFVNLLKKLLLALPRFMRTSIESMLQTVRPGANLNVFAETVSITGFHKSNAWQDESISCISYTEVPALVVPEKGSKLVLFGQPWISNDRYIAALDSLVSQYDLDFTPCIPDIIYVSDVNSFPFKVRHKYRERLDRILSLSKSVLTISDAARKDLERYRKVSGLSFDVKRIRLPAPEFQADKKLEFSVEGDYVLYVSSINGRKNHRLLIDVWNDLYRNVLKKKRPDVRLLLAGSVQQGFEGAEDKSFQRSMSDANIEILSGLSDSQIATLYEKCLFTVYPSKIEGWGFPVQESLYAGKLCIASETVPSANESESSGVLLVKPESYYDWYEMIETFLTNDQLLSAVSSSIDPASVSDSTWNDLSEFIISI